MGVSQKLMTRALAEATEIPEPDLAHRLMGDWSPERTTWARLILSPDAGEDLSRPYPFYLAYQLDDGPDALGDPADWAAEHKWDGIRGQLILRGGAHHLWSRGEELMTDRFPELAAARDFLPDGTVLDGEVLAWSERPPPSLRRPPEAHRPQDRAEEAPHRSPRDPARLRPPRMGRRRHPRPPLRRPPHPPRSPRPRASPPPPPSASPNASPSPHGTTSPPPAPAPATKARRG